MVRAKLDDMMGWLAAMRNVRITLTEPLVAIFRDRGASEVERTMAATLLAHYAADRPTVLVDLLADADVKSFSILFPPVERNKAEAIPELLKVITPSSAGGHGVGPSENELAKDHRATRRATAGIALARWSSKSDLASARIQPRSRTRSAFINALSSFGVEPDILADELQRQVKLPADAVAAAGQPREGNAYLFDPAISMRRGLILGLAAYPPKALDPQKSDKLIATLSELYGDDPDAGTHSATGLVLRRWGQHDLPEIAAPPPLPGEKPQRRWFVNREGQTMVVIDPVEFNKGSPVSEDGHQRQEVLHRASIRRRFAIGCREITVDEFQRYAQAQHGRPHEFARGHSPDHDGPQIEVSWFEGCGISTGSVTKRACRGATCPTKKGNTPWGCVDQAAVEKGGYRFPTDSEWEYSAGRARKRADIMAIPPSCWGNTSGLLTTRVLTPIRAEDYCPTTWACSTC